MIIFVFQLVKVIREADTNETSGGLGMALPGNLLGESPVENTEGKARHYALQHGASRIC